MLVQRELLRGRALVRRPACAARPRRQRSCNRRAASDATIPLVLSRRRVRGRRSEWRSGTGSTRRNDTRRKCPALGKPLEIGVAVVGLLAAGRRCRPRSRTGRRGAPAGGRRRADFALAGSGKGAMSGGLMLKKGHASKRPSATAVPGLPLELNPAVVPIGIDRWSSKARWSDVRLQEARRR